MTKQYEHFDESVEVVCSKCNHTWNYGGYKTKFIGTSIDAYVQCPVCHKNLKLKGGKNE